MKTVYVVFLASNFKSGRFIRFITGGRFNHVALSLTPEISKMYSFARANYYQPLLGGFEVEQPDRYISPTSDVFVRICAYEVSDERYEDICRRLEYMTENRYKTRYNVLSILTYPFKRSVRIENAYTCVDFLTELLGLGQGYSITRLERRLSNSTIYLGLLSHRVMMPAAAPNMEFYRKQSSFATWCKTAALISILCGHFIQNVSCEIYGRMKHFLRAFL